MTAINAFRTKNEIVIFTDGATYNRQLEITEFGSKLCVFPHLPLIVMGCGVSNVIDRMAGDVAKLSSSFEDVLRVLRSPASLEYNEMLRLRAQVDSFFRLRLFLAGFEGGSPVLYSYEPIFSDELFKEEVIINPWRDDLPCVVAFEGEPRLIHDMIEVMEYQRAHCLDEGRSAVGGFVQMTTLARDRITTRIVHRWPGDRVGERISLQNLAAA